MRLMRGPSLSLRSKGRQFKDTGDPTRERPPPSVRNASLIDNTVWQLVQAVAYTSL